MQADEPGGSSRLGFNIRDFKVCDFCGALNLVTNHKCFICGWSGRFHRDAESIQAAIFELEREHGQLSGTLFTEEILPDEPGRRAGFFRRLLVALRQFLQG